MQVLVTSDDGERAPGLDAVASAVLSARPESLVAAPVEEAGNYGTSLRRSGWARHPEDLRAYGDGRRLALPATPALIVRAACQGFLGRGRPDLVLVGINHGPNVGRDVLHSGTVGAALTAANLGVPALAVSLDDVHSTGGEEDGHMCWDAACEVAATLLDLYADAPSTGTVLNVNVPNRPLRHIIGVRPALLAPAGDQPGRSSGTDVELLAAGHITLTALTALDGVPWDAAPIARRLEEQLRPRLGSPLRPATRLSSTTRGGPP